MRPFSFAHPRTLSRRSPTGRPTRLRHFVAYHNPDRMGYEFYTVEDFAVVTDSKARDLVGAVVWCVGRLRGTAEYYLDARFRIESVRVGNFQGFTKRVSASDGLLFFPVERIDTLPWFPRLRLKTANFIGLQSILDPVVLGELQYCYEVARYIQGASPRRPKPPSRADAQ